MGSLRGKGGGGFSRESHPERGGWMGGVGFDNGALPVSCLMKAALQKHEFPDTQ